MKNPYTGPAMPEQVVVVFCEEYARGSFVVRALTGAGYAVRWVTRVETALRLAARERVDALVADARSDDVLGSLVSGWRRRTPPGTPVVLLTRLGDAASVALAEVVSSPLTAEGVRAAVDHALGARARA